MVSTILTTMNIISFEERTFEGIAAKFEYSKIGNKTYYRPEDVERIIRIVEDRRREAKWRGRTI